jgi:hypothetical protein
MEETVHFFWVGVPASRFKLEEVFNQAGQQMFQAGQQISSKSQSTIMIMKLPSMMIMIIVNIIIMIIIIIVTNINALM